MLSGETAMGEYPVESIQVMDKIALAVEPSLDYRHEIPEAHEEPRTFRRNQVRRRPRASAHFAGTRRTERPLRLRRVSASKPTPSSASRNAFAVGSGLCERCWDTVGVSNGGALHSQVQRHLLTLGDSRGL